MNLLPKALALALIAASLGACASRQQIADDYRELLKHEISPSESKRTVVFFLVDGLPIKTVSDALSGGQMPATKQYFLGNADFFYRAHTSFPSVTFPAIASVLSERPVDQNGIYGNLFRQGEDVRNYENISEYARLNDQLRGHTIFSRLRAKGLRTVSFDYAFYTGSSVHSQLADLEVGLAISEQEYGNVDLKTLEGLDLLLRETPTARWPEFIFVHLLGIDFTSHDAGPTSPKVTSYLHVLDQRLARIYRTLESAERLQKHPVVALMSADHGFDIPVERILYLEEALDKSNPEITVLNEGRNLGLYFPPTWPEARRTEFLSAQLRRSELELIVSSAGGRITIRSKKSTTTTTTIDLKDSSGCVGTDFALSFNAGPWQCPNQLDAITANAYYPFFISNLAHYFRASGRPDAVLIGHPGVAFMDKYRGQHGGPTEPEVLVPLLLHGLAPVDRTQVPALWELLDFM